ncbi:hypothetical protein KKH39_00615 [Patescibacteria group bacterium]|nr:hypothetical protein [Patescibacteria group bacterium]
MFYRKVYKNAWQAIHNNMSVIFFGIFASLLGFHEVKILFNLTGTTPDFLGTSIESWLKILLTFATAKVGLSDLPNLMTLVGFFVVFAIATILAISSQGALIKAAGEKKKTSSMIERLRVGVEKFWPLLGLNVINTLLGYFFIALVIEPLIYFLSNSQDWSIYIILGIVTFFVLIPMIIILSFVTRYGAAYVVLKNQNFSEAFLNSWVLFKANWVITIENALLLLFITVLFFVLMFTALVFVFVPFMILAMFMSFSVLAFWIIMVIGVFLAIFVFIFGTAYYGALYNMVWTYIFLELVSPGKSQSKVHRLAHKHLPRLAK